MRKGTRQIAFCGLLLGLTVALSLLEGLLPPLPFFPPGVKLGFANLCVLLCVFWKKPAFGLFLTVAKAMTAFFTGGWVTFCFSLTGGLLALGFMLLLVRLPKLPEAAISMGGALISNLGQSLFAVLFYRNSGFFYYLPVVIPAALLSGFAVGLIWHLLEKPLAPVRNVFIK